MENERVSRKLLETIKGYKSRKIFEKVDEIRKDKVEHSLEDVIKKVGLKNGMTISFHHHFRNGDKVMMMVVKKLADMGFKDLRIAASSFTKAHEGIVEYIRRGVVTRIESSGLRGDLATEISNGILGENPAVIRSHGGRARAIVEGDLKIDVAFLGVSSSDCLGNSNGVRGKSICGSLGYAKVDAQYADKVVVITDTLVEYPNTPISIPQTQVDYVLIVNEIGDSNGIMSGATRYTSNPKELLMAKKVLEVMLGSGYFKDGFSMQTGSGGASLAVTRFIREELLNRNIKCSYGLGGITKAFVDLLEEGLIGTLFDTQCFDLSAVESLGKNKNHIEVSADFYANPTNSSPAVNKLDFVILSALEIDKNFNVNVISGSDGIIREASGGHSDTAAAANVSIVVAPLTRGRIPTIIDEVTTIVTPGNTVDVIVTDYGVAVNPLRKDLEEKLIEYGLELTTMDELRKKADFIVGKPQKIEFDDKVVAVVEYRDGSIIDVVKKIKR